ncbi:MAG: RHS repeat protein, partial [Gammaproteobacteria bacterium]|nr:RHS repeat protein [Gammaproteobacteria bacterium]
MEFNNKVLVKLSGIVLLVAVGVLLRVEPSFAVDGIQARPLAPPTPKYGLYSETVEDMRVKVHGGYIRVVRNRRDKKWHINQRWAPIYKGVTGTSVSQSSLGYGGGSSDGVALNFQDTSSSGQIYINRAGFRYLNVGTDRYALKGNPNLIITERDVGDDGSREFLWENHEGDWIRYDEDGDIQAYGDKNNVEVTFAYNTSGKIIGLFDTLGKQILWYEYDTSNRVSAIRDYSGRKVQYFYTGDSKLDRVIDVRGNTWFYEYSGDFLVKKIEPEGREIFIEGGQVVTSVLDQDDIGIHYKYEYNKTRKEFYRQEKTTAGKVTESWFDEEGDLVRRDINGRSVRTMVKSGSTETITDLNGLKTIEQYDTLENLIKRTHPDGTSVSYHVETQFSNVTQMADENGVVTNYEYDANGNLERMTEAVGLAEQRVTEYGYDIYGNQTLIKTLGDGNSAETSIVMTYDDYGNLETYTDAENHVAEYLEYDVIGNEKQMKDARGNVWKYGYDADGNLLSEETPLGYLTQYAYDKVGNLETVTDANLKVSRIGHDGRNRAESVTNPLLETSTLTYNDNDQVTSFTNALGHVISFKYNLSGDLIKLTDPAGNEISLDYGYAGTGAFKGLLNSISYPTYAESYTYDNRNRRATSQHSSDNAPGRESSYSYDAAGNLKTTTDAKTRDTTETYDNLNRTFSILDTAQQLTQLAYDNRDNLTQVTNARNIAIRQYQYDKNDQILKEILPDGDSLLEHSYDANGNLQQSIDAKGQVVTYSYDIDDRLNKVQYFNDLASAADPLNAQKTVDFTYDNLNRIKTWDDGSSSGTYDYDDA